MSRLWGNPVGARDFVVTYTVRESFSVDGRPFAKGEVLAKGDPVVAPVLKERPDLLMARACRADA